MTDFTADFAASDPGPTRFWLLAAGIVLVLGGLTAMVHPFATSFDTAIVLGSAMVAGGAVAVAAGIADRGADRRLYVPLGLAGLVLGIVVLLYPFVDAGGLVWTIGAWLAAGGLLQLVLGFRGRRYPLALLGLVDAAMGVLLMLIMDPISAVFFLAVAVGFSFLLHGLALLVLAFRRRPASA